MSIYINQAEDGDTDINGTDLVNIKIQINHKDGVIRRFWIHDVTKNLLRCALGDADMEYLLEQQRDTEEAYASPVDELAFGCTPTELGDFIKDGEMANEVFFTRTDGTTVRNDRYY